VVLVVLEVVLLVTVLILMLAVLLLLLVKVLLAVQMLEDHPHTHQVVAVVQEVLE
jgi:hypothetical protein